MARLTLGLVVFAAALAGAAAVESAGSCYDSGDTHMVTCNVAEADCNTDADYYWYAPGYVSGMSGCCHCESPCDTTGADYPTDCDYYDVYNAIADVTNHQSIALDVGEIKDALSSDPPDYAAATTLYQEGKNSPKSSSMRTLQGFGQKVEEAEVMWIAGNELFGSGTWLDDLTSAALAGTGVYEGASDDMRTTAINKNLLCSMVFYAAHEGEEAMLKAADGVPAGNATDDTTNKYWDEFWAFYYGLDGSNAPYAVAGKRDSDFLTTVQEDTNTLLIHGQYFAEQADSEKVNGYFTDILNKMAITYAQAALKYAYKAEADPTDMGTYAEGYVYFRCGAPIMYMTAPTEVAAADAAFKITAGVTEAPSAYCAVKAAVDAWVEATDGVDAADIGTYASDHGDATTAIPDDYCDSATTDDHDDHDDHDDGTDGGDGDSPAAGLAAAGLAAAAALAL